MLQPRGSVWNAELSPQARSSARVAWRRRLRQARLEAAPAPRRTWPPGAHGALGLRPCRVSREDPSCSASLLSWRGSDWPALGAAPALRAQGRPQPLSSHGAPSQCPPGLESLVSLGQVEMGVSAAGRRARFSIVRGR